MREKYFGWFVGNQCRLLLKKVNVLEELIMEDCDKHREKEFESHPAKVFLDVLRALDDLVKGCFGKTLCDDYSDKISKFSDNYDKSKISITSKAHAIKAHLKTFLDKNQVGLALFSEQAFEAIHSKFLSTWEKYKVKDQTNPNFFKALFKAVIDFNSTNMI